jgi:hypothetical protein
MVPSLAGVLVSLLSCHPVRHGSDELLENIEKGVVLPAGARPIRDYSKYYSFTKSGMIKALYIIHDPNFVQDARLRCKESHLSRFPCGPVPGELALVQPGHRKLLANPSELPTADGGGCTVIQFIYDPAKRAQSPAQCNGDY